MIRLVVSCEHASPEVPPGFQNLGVEERELWSHNSFDAGAAVVAKEIAASFGVFPYLGTWSRLLADCNRSPENPDAVPEVSFGLYVPGNARLSQRDRVERLRRYHRPYREAVRKAVREIIDQGDVCLHFAVHSFTPEYEGVARDGEAGVLYDPEHALEARFAERMLSVMKQTLDVRPNYPYSGTVDALCTSLRGEMPSDRYAGVEVEISQALAATRDGLLRTIDAIERALYAAIRPAP